MSQFSGSLVAKRKSDLVEIADALGIKDQEGTNIELRERIQSKLDANADSLRTTDAFKGLYGRSRRHQTSDGSDTPAPEKTPGRGRRSINKTLEKIVDAANIPLPDSPLSSKIQEKADNALALVETDTKDIAARISDASSTLVKFVDGRKNAVEGCVRDLRDILSTPCGLIPVAIAIEEAFLYSHVVSLGKHVVHFPPLRSDKGTLASLLRTAFFWAPSISWSYCFPTLESVHPSSDVWPATAWWFFSTVLPPLVLSSLVSFIPQKGIHRAGASTRYQAAHPPTPTFDPLTFVFFRLAILLLPLTNAAPAAFVDALEMSGNSQARALGAGLLAALIIAQRLGGATRA
ncbi:uncharacterized protein EHS24_000547 [Apiotrichum porosum]|uniref:Uncharacterized protein n=1 Tax=Apiotrichum porosum TaxID=105984 RepID=A0A427YA89_9TREE|nr:uncharacterized protein EHS24_000547 [Apiotrichum porosum]RSH88023.1 hypothetical protein EHS24_000547 [Apiotrichum porosum]